MPRTLSLLTVLLAAPVAAWGQQPVVPAAPGAHAASTAGGKLLDPSDLASWKSIRFATLSDDGKWFAYQLAPNEGDAEVIVRPTAEGKERRFPIGDPPAGAGGFNQGAASSNVAFSRDGRWLAFVRYPTTKETKALQKQKKPLQNGVVVMNLATGETREFDKVRRFAFNGDKPSWLAMHRYGDAPSGPSAPGTPPAPRSIGSDMLLWKLGTDLVANVGNVGEFGFDESGEWLAWTVDGRDAVGNGLQLRNMKSDVVHVLDSEKALYRRLAWADSGASLAVLRGRADSAASDTAYAVVGFANVASPTAKTIYLPTDTSSGFPIGMRVSPDRSPRWAEDRSAVFFGLTERRITPDSGKGRPDVKPVAGTPGAIGPGGAGATDDDELPSLVIWHWKEPRLQSQQQVEEGRDKTYSYLAEYRVVDRRFIRLSDDALRDVTLAPRDRFAIGSDSRAYDREASYSGRRFRDIYAVDVRTGQRRRLAEKVPVQGFLAAQLPSPDGAKLLYWNDGQYTVQDLATGDARVITRDVPTTFVDTEDDHNVQNPPIAPVGWSRDSRSVLLYDDWDLWRVPVAGGSAVNLTTVGRKDSVRYYQRLRFDPKEKGIDLAKPIYVATYGEWTKKEGLARIDPGKAGVTTLMWDDAKFGVTRARDAETFAFTKQTFTAYPDWYASDAAFKAPRRLTDANPEQKDFAWSSGARLVDYTSDKGDKLQGALFLPANYQSGKSYPTVVYIYEKLSQSLHQYALPNETRAFNPSVYTSRGYAVLMPDIVYKLNDPGMSAVWSVVPAVKAAIATGIVDSANVGLHGHSWGGYQTAFLVTQTNIFKSAIAGAALTDMVSMYSSVYWNSGGTNQAIFESSQGRFKGNYADNYEAYIRNSPVFHARDVKTPLMLLHNEHDGAVDFNQGITYYNTLRQLGKEVILLQYVGENHGLAQPRNQKDYTVRMEEFFDHHLQGKAAPKWMVDGVPRLKMEQELKDRKKKPKVAS